MRILLALIPVALLPGVYAAAAVQAPAASPAAATRVGFLSSQRIMAESSQAKADLARLQTLQQQKQTDLRGKQQVLEATRQRLQAADAASRDRLQQDEQRQRAELERATAQAQTEMQALQRQIQGELQTAVRPVVEEIAKRENLQMIVNDTAVVWASPTLDITAAVIERLNAKP